MQQKLKFITTDSSYKTTVIKELTDKVVKVSKDPESLTKMAELEDLRNTIMNLRKENCRLKASAGEYEKYMRTLTIANDKNQNMIKEMMHLDTKETSSPSVNIKGTLSENGDDIRLHSCSS